MQEVIRVRELAFQDSLNPNLGDLRSLPEPRHYSGRRAKEDWHCPFHGAGAQNE